MIATLQPLPESTLPTGATTTTVVSDLLGTIELPADAVYTLPAGLYAFEGLTRYALLPAGRAGLYWLQSVEQSGLVFLLADPFHFFSGYEANLPDEEIAKLGVTRPEQIGVLVIVTLPGGEAGATASANLRAPIVLDPAARQGRQIVLPDSPYTVREPLALG